jgi:hypothetical protein
MIEPVNYAATLTYAYSGTIWTMDGVEYSGIHWLDENTPKPTQAALDAAWPNVQHDLAVASIRAERHRRYLEETDPLFMKAQRDEEDGVTMADWKAAVAAVKAELPYPPAP